MLSTSAGPLSLPFNVAMTVGSAINGNAQDVLTYGGRTLINIAETAAFLNPCGLIAKGLTAYNIYNNVSDMIQNGVNLSNGSDLALNVLSMFFSCFTGEMLLDVEGGKKRADAIAVGDKLWSRSEFDPDGPLMLKEVEECFVRVSLVLNLRVAGQVLRTTGEHPFWVQNRGRWLPARELKVGDLLRTRCGSLVAVEGLEDSGQVETVYNWRIADYHTYYVSATENRVSVWAHNATYNPGRAGKSTRLRQLVSDPSLSSAARGWIQQELNQIARGKRSNIRLPPGMVLAHRRGMEAKRGFSYLFSDLQDVVLHKLQHAFEGY